MEEKIRQLIATNRLPEALQALYEALPAHLKNDALALQNQLEDLQRNERLGMIGFSEASIRRANITNGALALTNQIGTPAPHQTPNPAPPPTQPSPTPAPAEPTKILFLSANPVDQERIQTDKELRNLVAELQRGRQRDKFQFLMPQIGATASELLRAMNEKPNIVHFSGHGEKNGILIANNNNETQLMPLPALERLFKPLQGIVQIIVLNACYSAEQAKVLSKFGAYVVGHNLPIADPAAISFSNGFYNGLGEGKTFEEAFNDGMIMVLTEHPNSATIVEVWKDGEQLHL